MINKLRIGKVMSLGLQNSTFTVLAVHKVDVEIIIKNLLSSFCRYDLGEEAQFTTSTIGIAFIGTLCTTASVSVVEEYFTATSGAVSAHELGHR